MPIIATVGLDCNTALQWSLANSGAATVPIAAAVGGDGFDMAMTGPASIAVPTAPCQSPGANRTTATANYLLQVGSRAPGAMRVGGFVAVTLPPAGVAGQTVVPSDSVNRSVTTEVVSVLEVEATAPVRVFQVTSETLDFNVTFVNLGNVPMQIIMNSTSQAVLEFPTVSLGTVSVPGSGPANATASFRFHAPLESWSEVKARIVVVPQLQTLAGVLHGPSVSLNLEFHNHLPSDNKSPAPGPLFAIGILGLAVLMRRRWD